jgi:hypothetical protein
VSHKLRPWLQNSTHVGKRECEVRRECFTVLHMGDTTCRIVL